MEQTKSATSQKNANFIPYLYLIGFYYLQVLYQNTMATLVYVDNSNVWIEGMHVSAVQNGHALNVFDAAANKICDYDWKFDFGKLLTFAGGERQNIKKAILFGSRPPQNDSLWIAAERQGFEVKTYDRNYSNKEKKIDTDIVATMMEDSYEIVDQDQDEMVIVAGDKDYVPMVEKLTKRGIRVILCFWGHAAQELISVCNDFYNLDDYLDHLRRD